MECSLHTSQWDILYPYGFVFCPLPCFICMVSLFSFILSCTHVFWLKWIMTKIKSKSYMRLLVFAANYKAVCCLSLTTLNCQRSSIVLLHFFQTGQGLLLIVFFFKFNYAPLLFFTYHHIDPVINQITWHHVG